MPEYTTEETGSVSRIPMACGVSPSVSTSSVRRARPTRWCWGLTGAVRERRLLRSFGVVLALSQLGEPPFQGWRLGRRGEAALQPFAGSLNVADALVEVARVGIR